METTRSLPPSVERKHIHSRHVESHGFLRADGLWDIEARIKDTKTYFTRNADGRERQPGEALHHMEVRLTLDDALKVIDAVAIMPGTPFNECTAASHPVRGLIGATVGPGWRKAIDEAMGGVRGCTHVRELILAMATVAYQTIPNYRAHERRERGEPTRTIGKPGHQIGKCLGWDTDGPVVARLTPELVGWRPQSWSRLFEHAGARDKWMGCGVRVLLGPLPGRRRRPPVGHVLMA